MPPFRVTAVEPPRATAGGRVAILGSDFPIDSPDVPEVRVGDLRARVVYASSSRIVIVVPSGITESGQVPIRIGDVVADTALLDIAAPFATGLHQVDNP